MASNYFQNFIPFQSFQQLKSHFTANNPFIDTSFRQSNDSIYFTTKFQNYLQKSNKLPLKWKRAKMWLK